MTRIALVIHRIGPYHCARLKALQARAGHVLALEICAQDRTYAWEVQDTGASFERETLFAHEDDLSPRALRGAIGAALDRWRPDIVAVPGWGDAAALYALEAAQRRALPVILMSDSRAGDARRTMLAETVKRVIVQSASGGLVAGRAHAAYLEALGMPANRIALGYDVVDNAHFAKGAEATRAEDGARDRLALPPAYFLVLTRMVAKKNLDVLLAAYARFRAETQDAPDLVMVGEGPLKETLRQQAGAGVQFRPFASYDAIPALMGLARGLVLASRVDQWGLVVNEAMAAGCPVLVSARAGAAELVTDGETGLVAEPDEAGLRHGLGRLARADRAAMGRAAQAAIDAWGPERFADGLMRVAADARPAGRARATVLGPLLRTLAARQLSALAAV